MVRAFILYTFLAILISACGNRFSLATSSMEPTLSKGETVKVDREAYSEDTPHRWDVIVFPNPETKKMWISRVVGLPGEMIDIREGSVYIGDELQALPDNMHSILYLPEVPGIPAKLKLSYTIGSDKYFFLGDNTVTGWDSRYSGTVALSSIIGRVNGK